MSACHRSVSPATLPARPAAPPGTEDRRAGALENTAKWLPTRPCHRMLPLAVRVIRLWGSVSLSPSHPPPHRPHAQVGFCPGCRLTGGAAGSVLGSSSPGAQGLGGVRTRVPHLTLQVSSGGAGEAGDSPAGRQASGRSPPALCLGKHTPSPGRLLTARGGPNARELRFLWNLCPLPEPYPKASLTRESSRSHLPRPIRRRVLSANIYGAPAAWSLIPANEPDTFKWRYAL